MISEIELQNVRIFAEPGVRFALPRLSVFCGTNSSGKSTILRSLLLLRQSQGIRESAGAASGRLRFVGSQVDLGSYKSFVSNEEIARPISIGITIEDVMPVDLARLLQPLSPGTEAPATRTRRETQPKLVDYTASFRFTFSAAHEHELLDDGTRHSPLGDGGPGAGVLAPQGILRRIEAHLTVDGNSLTWEVRRKEVSDSSREYEILLPQDYIRLFSETSELMQFEASEREGFVRATTILDGVLPGRIVARMRPRARRGRTDKEEKDRWALLASPPHVEGAIGDFKGALRDIHYLEPLRTAAKRYYLTSSDVMPNLDPAGEFLPYVLRYRADDRVFNVRPGNRDRVHESLSSALNSWLYYLRVGAAPAEGVDCEEIQVHTQGDVVVQFEIKSVSGRDLHALMDSGFGYSQLLPILVRGLLADPGSTLIVEEPELHLNPALQVRLADFFAAMTYAGKQIIIETHSEHLVNAIRVLAAEDDLGVLASESAIFFIDVETGVPIVHELSIKPDGTVPDWPYCFFGEAASLTGRLLRAQKRFRSQEKVRREEA